MALQALRRAAEDWGGVAEVLVLRSRALGEPRDRADTLVEIARDADLFVTECYACDKPIRYHLNYRTLAQNLPRLTAKKLILTHMSDEMLAQLDKVPELTASDGKSDEHFGVSVALDGGFDEWVKGGFPTAKT